VEENNNKPAGAEFVFLSSKDAGVCECVCVYVCVCVCMCVLHMLHPRYKRYTHTHTDLRNLESTRACFQKVRV
jgi:hypothetical protein